MPKLEMLDWLSKIPEPPRKIFITHGEAAASSALKEKIETRFKWDCVVPEYNYKEELV